MLHEEETNIYQCYSAYSIKCIHH